MIETARLIIRPPLESDRAPFAAMSCDPKVMASLGPMMDRAASDAALDRMTAAHAAHGFAFWAVEQKADGAFIGLCGLLPVHFTELPPRNIEIGWRLRRASWGAGLASEAARAVLDWGFARGMLAIIAFTATRNLASQRVMQRIGMARRADLDFDHPRLVADDPLRRHIVYEARP